MNEDDPVFSQVKPVDQNGHVTFSKLPYGLYKIDETKQPTGYVKTEGPYFITIDEHGASELDITVAHELISVDGNTFTIQNEPGAVLPSTGGPGTAAYTAGGAAMMLLAIALMLLRRKKA